jgi:hypothetical protein
VGDYPFGKPKERKEMAGDLQYYKRRNENIGGGRN